MVGILTASVPVLYINIPNINKMFVLDTYCFYQSLL